MITMTPTKKTTMNAAVIAIAMGLALSAAHVAAAADPVTVTKISTPQKALKFEVVVPASVDDVWKAFTTTDGLQTWLWRDCAVDLRTGGEWTANFGTSTGGGMIMSFAPKRELVIAALAPEKFPAVRKARTTAVFSFVAVTPTSTRITLMQTGWQQGAEWDAAYDYLATGNAQLLTALHTRFVSGPIDWSKGQ